MSSGMSWSGATEINRRQLKGHQNHQRFAPPSHNWSHRKLLCAHKSKISVEHFMHELLMLHVAQRSVLLHPKGKATQSISIKARLRSRDVAEESDLRSVNKKHWAVFFFCLFSFFFHFSGLLCRRLKRSWKKSLLAESLYQCRKDGFLTNISQAWSWYHTRQTGLYHPQTQQVSPVSFHISSMWCSSASATYCVEVWGKYMQYKCRGKNQTSEKSC